MKRYLYRGVIALIISHALTELYMLVWLIWPNSATAKANLFLSKNGTPYMSVLWYIKDTSDNLLWAISYFFFTYIAYLTSRKLFIIMCLLCLYHCFDGIMYMVNYKQSRWLYLVLLAVDMSAIIVALLPIKEKAKVVNLQ